MRGYNQNRNGRSYRKYCEDEAIDYNWVIKYNKKYPLWGKDAYEGIAGCFLC